MRALLFILALLAAFPVQAQTKLLQAHAATSTFTGPGDVVASAGAWYSCTRGYTAAYAATGTGKACNVRRASDNATQDVVILTTGAFDIASANTFAGPDGGTGVCTGSTAGSSTTLTISVCTASATLHAGDTLTCASCAQPVYILSLGTFTGTGAGAAGTVTLNVAQNISSQSITSQVALFLPKAYDQSGGTADAPQATAGSQPQLLPDCGALKPCILTTQGGTNFTTATITSINSPLTFSGVANQVTAAGGTQRIFASNFTGGNQSQVGYASSANGVYVYAGAFSAAVTASDGSFHALQYVSNNTSSLINVDGVDSSALTPGAGAASTSLRLYGNSAGGGGFGGHTYEIGEWAGAFSGGQRTSMCNNQRLYYGTGGSC